MANIRDLSVLLLDVGRIARDYLDLHVDRAILKCKDAQLKIFEGVLFVALAIVLACGGLGLILFSIHLRLSFLIGQLASGVLIGSILILCAVIMALLARSRFQE